MSTTLTDPQKSKLIREEIEASFTHVELADFDSFDDFWDEIDAQQGYEENWEDEKAEWKPFYRSNFYNMRSLV